MKFYRWAAALALVALCSVVSHAQTDQGRFSGIVRDSQSAFVPDATVTIKNEKTGETRTVMSNAQGLAVVAGLKPSTYTISVEKAGFAPIEYTNIPIAVGQELTLDFQLQTAGVQETI